MIRCSWLKFTIVFFLLACNAAIAQDYEVYVKNHPLETRVIFIKKSPYLPFNQLCKTLELEINKKDGIEWIGQEPDNPKKGMLYVNGQPFSDTLVKDGVTYVRLTSFLPLVGHQLLMNDQTRVIDILKKRENPADKFPINRYLSDEILRHFEKYPELHVYLASIKSWNTALGNSLQESIYAFDPAMNAIQNIESYQDLYKVTEQFAKAFKSQSQRLDDLQDSFPAGKPPKEFAKSHAILVGLQEICASLDTASGQAYHTVSGIRTTTDVEPGAYVTKLDLSPLLENIFSILEIHDSLAEHYAAYLKTLRSELMSVLLLTHFTSQAAKNYQPDFALYRMKLQRVRKLDFATRVEGVKITPEEEEKQFEKAMSEVRPEKLEQDDATLKDLGFIPRYRDTKKVDFKAEADEVPAFYDPETKKFYYRSDVPEDFFEVICYHELEHALADQHFDLARLHKGVSNSKSSDMELATRSLVEGDAQYTMILPEVEKYLLSEDFLESTLLMYQVGTSFSTTEGPMVFKEETFFPYEYGMKFVKQLNAWGGWDLVNSAYKDPPKSSHQILHPEYYALAREEPVDFIFPEDSSAKLIADDVLGEFNILVLYATYHSGSKEDFSGWSGDRFHILRKDNHDFVVWVSSWRSEAQAARFADIYKELLARIEDQGDTSKAPEKLSSDDKERANFENIYGKLSENQSAEETVLGKSAHPQTSFTTVITQKGNLVQILEDVPAAEIDYWKNYADRIKPVIPDAAAPPQAVAWPFQSIPIHFLAKLDPAYEPLAAALKNSAPKSWRLMGTDSPAFPMMAQSPFGDRFYFGKGKLIQGASEIVTSAALTAFASHNYPSVEFTHFAEKFGSSLTPYQALKGTGTSLTGDPINVTLWTQEASTKTAYLMIGESAPERLVRNQSIFRQMMDELTDVTNGH